MRLSSRWNTFWVPPSPQSSSVAIFKRAIRLTCISFRRWSTIPSQVKDALLLTASRRSVSSKFVRGVDGHMVYGSQPKPSHVYLIVSFYSVEGSLTYSVYKNNEGGRRRLDGDDDLLQQIYDAIAQALQELTANGRFGFIEALEVTGNFGLASDSDSGTFLTNGIIAGVMCGLVAISAVVIFAVWRKRKKMKYYDDSVAEGSAIEYYEEKEAHESFQMPREAYVVNEMEESVEVGSILRDLNTLKPAEPNSPSGIQFISTRPPRPASPDYQSTIEELAPVSPRSADPSYKVFDTVDL